MLSMVFMLYFLYAPALTVASMSTKSTVMWHGRLVKPPFSSPRLRDSGRGNPFASNTESITRYVTSCRPNNARPR
jgi:hypothetical protein